jgi:ATP-binding cassette subfamily G (WHITE) protein 2 (SNQ2)
MAEESFSASASAVDLTAYNSPTPTLTAKQPHLEKNAKTGLFVEPGTIPLPDHGYHHIGVVWEDVTVFGAGGTRKTVEGLETAILNVRCFRLVFSLILC